MRAQKTHVELEISAGDLQQVMLKACVLGVKLSSKYQHNDKCKT